MRAISHPIPGNEHIMIELRNVSYVRMGTRDLEGAEAFATDYLGLEMSERHKNAVYFKSDARAHTLCYFAGDPNDQAVAFEIASQAELEQAAATLEAMPLRSPARQRRRSRAAQGHCIHRLSRSDRKQNRAGRPA